VLIFDARSIFGWLCKYIQDMSLIQKNMPENSLIKQNILKYIDYKCITKYKLYQITGISRGVLDQNNGLSEDNTAKFLAQFKDVDANWLLTGEGTMIKGYPILEEQPTNVVSEPKKTYDKKGSIPLIPLSAIAGKANGDVSVMDYDVLDRYIIPEFQGKADFLIRVAGTSMSPKFYHGDLIACKKISEITFIQWGKAYVLDTSQGPIIKRLYQDPTDPENILCVSDNKDLYPPFVIPKSDIRSMSIVIGSIRVE